VYLLTLLQSATASPPENGCLVALLTWGPVVALVVFFWFLVRRMGYFSKTKGYVRRSEDHMERVEQTLQKIEEHLRILAERGNRE
jgi:hypothetical protein